MNDISENLVDINIKKEHVERYSKLDYIIILNILYLFLNELKT